MMSLYSNRSNWLFEITFLLLAAGSTLFAPVLPSANAQASNSQDKTTQQEETVVTEQNTGESVATFGGGCFWCVEAVFQELEGVSTVKSGYMGGHVKNPTYAQICDKKTGHAEVCQITYDPIKITYQRLLEVFFATHDPTTLNQQGNDFGPQYRSVVFYHDQDQQKIAGAIITKLDEAGAFNRPIVTEVTEASVCYPAEDYHQDYFSLNPRQPYCQAVIVPKMAKFRKVFEGDLKSK